MAKQWDGIGQRITERLRALGYWNERRDRPDVTRFALDFRHVPTYVYRWVNDEVEPDRENLMRLASELGVSPAWLLMGDDGLKTPRKPPRRRMVAVPVGSSGQGDPLPVEVVPRVAIRRTLNSATTRRGRRSTRNDSIHYRNQCETSCVCLAA